MSGDTGGVPTDRYVDTMFYTKFNLNNLDSLKSMLDGASVQTVRDVARNWQLLHDDLVGEDGQGGIQKRFTDAVNKVMESWHGEAANRFQKKAQEIVENFQNGAPFAVQTAKVMGATAQDLQKAVDKVSTTDDGWNWSDDVWGEMPWSDQIDDDDLDKALKSGASTGGILEANKDNLSSHQKKRLEAAVAMETLGTSYMTRATGLRQPGSGPGRPYVDDRRSEHPDQKDLGGMPMPMGLGSGPGGGGGGGNLKIPTRGMKSATPKMPETPKMPDQQGISGGLGSMKPHTPDVKTGLDGLGGGSGIKIPNAGGPGPGMGGGTGVHIPSGGGGGGGIPGIPGGGMPGRGLPTGGLGGVKSGPGGTGGVKNGPGGTGGVKSGPGGTGATGGTGARSGRPGMPGMGGAHAGGGGKGAGGRGGGGVSGGGAQARQKGGIVGSTGGKTSGGSGTQGGSGLHRSRGGAAAGTNSGSGRRPAGMMGGAHGAHGAKGKGEGQNGNRPDYLVEDEETWTPERNVAPRVIE